MRAKNILGGWKHYCFGDIVAEALLAGVVLNAALSARKKLAAKTQPLKIGIQSETTGFNISPYTFASGIISGIRVQDIPRNIWYNWDRPGPWSPSEPNVTVGSKTLYIAFWAVNQGNVTGTLTLTVKDDTGATLATKSVSCAPGAGVGIEAPNLDMPNRTYGITLSVTP